MQVYNYEFFDSSEDLEQKYSILTILKKGLIMSVPFYNFQELHNQELLSEVKERYNEILETNAFIEGKYNTLFEQEFAEKQQAKYCRMVANGTDALEISLKAYGVDHGDKVGLPNISFYASAEAIVNIGAEIVFIDVDPATGLMCPESLKRILKNHKLKAIMPVHIYGLNAPIETLEKICSEQNIKIVEDAAQAQGGFYENGKPVGSSNNLITYSFYPTKNLGGFGDAGGILGQCDELDTKIKLIRNHGRAPEGHIMVGRNSRCDSFQAAVLHLKLKKIDQHNKQRKEIAGKYFEGLSGLKDIQLVPERFVKTSSWHLFPIQLENDETRRKLSAALKDKNIGNTLFYEKALSEEKPIHHYEGEKAKAIEFSQKVLCLPMNPFINDQEIKTVCSTIAANFS